MDSLHKQQKRLSKAEMQAAIFRVGSLEPTVQFAVHKAPRQRNFKLVAALRVENGYQPIPCSGANDALEKTSSAASSCLNTIATTNNISVN